MSHIEEFYNKVHSKKDGRFAETPGPGHSKGARPKTAAEKAAHSKLMAKSKTKAGSVVVGGKSAAVKAKAAPAKAKPAPKKVVKTKTTTPAVKAKAAAPAKMTVKHVKETLKAAGIKGKVYMDRNGKPFVDQPGQTSKTLRTQKELDRFVAARKGKPDPKPKPAPKPKPVTTSKAVAAKVPEKAVKPVPKSKATGGGALSVPARHADIDVKIQGEKIMVDGKTSSRFGYYKDPDSPEYTGAFYKENDVMLTARVGDKNTLGGDGGPVTTEDIVRQNVGWDRDAAALTSAPPLPAVKGEAFEVDYSSESAREKAWHASGSNAPMKIAKDSDLDDLIADGGIEIFRGIASVGGSADKFGAEFRTGATPRTAGGITGQGYYTSPNLLIAKRYARLVGWSQEMGKGKGNVTRMVIPKTAKSISVENAMKISIGGRKPSSEDEVGDFARRAGYDVVVNTTTQTGEPYYIVVNRGVLTASETNYA